MKIGWTLRSLFKTPSGNRILIEMGMAERTRQDWEPTKAFGTSAVEFAVGTWRLSIGRVPRYGADLIQVYDRSSSHWQRLQALAGYTKAYPELFRKLKADGWLSHLGNDSLVLDCGTGTGVMIRPLLSQLSLSPGVHAVDLSTGMLSAAKSELEKGGVDVRLQVADARELPFADRSFDMVMSAHMLEHLPEPGEGLREIARVLRPQGLLLIITTRDGAPDALLRLVYRYHTLKPDWLKGRLRQLGFGRATNYPLGERPRLARWLSAAYVATLSGPSNNLAVELGKGQINP